MEKEEQEKIIKEMLKNPKITKAMKGILVPLKQEGDRLTISTGEK